MKVLSSFMVFNVNGSDRVSYTYDEINDNTGEPISLNNKSNFYVTDSDITSNIDAIRTYIREHKLS
jgi:hypothetical protein